MSKNAGLVKNAAGRLVPTIVNGQPQVPFQGVGKHTPTGRKAFPAGNVNSRV
jgi:citrate lyase subunit alpha/citrate CoA-transferase